MIGLPRTPRPKWGGVVTVTISAPWILSDPAGQHTGTWTLGPDHASVLIRFIRMQTVTSPMPYIRIAIVGHRGRAGHIPILIPRSAGFRNLPGSMRQEPRFPSQRLPRLNGHIVLRAILYNGRLHRPKACIIHQRLYVMLTTTVFLNTNYVWIHRA